MAGIRRPEGRHVAKVQVGASSVEISWLDLGRTPVQRAYSCLDPQERAQAETYLSDHDRHAFVARRAGLRQVLARHLGLPPAEIGIATNSNGKPHVASRAHSHVRFSAASSSEWAVVAVVKGGAQRGREVEIGVDMEMIRPLPYAQVAEAAWGEAETQRILTSAEPSSAFFETWVAYEACLKMRGGRLADGASLSDLRAGATVVSGLAGCPAGYASALAVQSI